MQSQDLSKVGVLIPCLNEALTISVVVEEFRRSLIDARIVVVDNGSVDDTRELAKFAGAELLTEYRRGKGFAVKRGLAAMADCSCVVLVDGDGTYSARHINEMLAALSGGVGMVIGARLTSAEPGAFPPTHAAGNRLFILLVRLLFGVKTTDLFSGYRVLTRKLLDEIILTSEGFEIETELTLRTLAHGFPIVEVPTPYSARLSGSHSKLRTISDGFRILGEVLAFFRDYRPMLCFGAIGLFLLVVGIVAGSFPVVEYFESGRVNRLPLAVLAVGLVLLSSVSAVAGLVLSSVARRAREMRIQIRTLIGKDA